MSRERRGRAEGGVEGNGLTVIECWCRQPVNSNRWTLSTYPTDSSTCDDMREKPSPHPHHSTLQVCSTSSTKCSLVPNGLLTNRQWFSESAPGARLERVSELSVAEMTMTIDLFFSKVISS